MAGLAAGTSGNGDITVASAIGKTAGGNAALTLSAAHSIILNAPISSTVGTLDVNLFADSGGLGSGAIVLNPVTSIISNGGNIALGGGVGGAGYAVGTASNINGILLDGASLDAGGGNITLLGTAGTAGNGAGVGITNSSVMSRGGAISITGIGGAATDGVSYSDGASITGSTISSQPSLAGVGETALHSRYGRRLSAAVGVSA